MGTGYTRNDTANNIADGNVINAADFDGEYDAIEAAFNATTGHTHDGTAAEGGPITVVGPVQDVVVSSTEMRPKTTNTLDLGTSSLEYKDLHLAGTANLTTMSTTGTATFTNDVTLTGASYNVVFDASDNALEFGDSAKATFGADADLQVYHDATNSYLENNTGELYVQGDGITLRSDTGTETYLEADVNGAVALYYDNSKKVETTTDGVTVTGTITMDGLDLGDDEKIRLGDNPDLEIFHNSTANQSRIHAAGSGDLSIAAADLKLSATAGTENYLRGVANGAVSIYYDNAIKLATATDGVDITGQLDISTDLNVTGDADIGDDLSLSSDGAVINIGADGDVTLTHEADTGIKAKAASGFELNLQTGDTAIESGDVLGKITFNAPDEVSGTDAILDGATIEAVAEATFASDNNTTALVFKTNTSAAATERMRIKGDGTIVMDTQVDIDNITIDGNTISSTDTNGNLILDANGTGSIVVNDDIISTTTNQNITLTPNGTGAVAISKVDIAAGEIDGITLGTNSAVTEAQIDNININGNAITSTDTDGNIALTPNGTGEVDISKVDIDSGAIDGVTIGTNSVVTDLRVDNIKVDGNTISATDTDGGVTISPNGTGNVTIGNLEFDADATKTDNHVLTYDATAGTIQLEAIPATSISNDTSPALGGTLTADGFNIEFDDSAAATDDRLRFGTGNDLEIYHDGTDSIIDNATSEGSIKIQDTSSTVVEIDAAGVTVTGRALSSDGTNAITTDSPSSNVITFDLTDNTNFQATTTGDDELTFSNTVAGQSGNIFLTTGGGTISANAMVAINADALTALATAGVYHLAYFVKAATGDNRVLVSVSGALT
jgi:hypothetical protein